MTSSRHLRVLCLHGYHSSGALLRRQMAPLAAALSPCIELAYVDAPSLSLGDFGWWHDGFSGWKRTRDWAVELLRTWPRVDGVFGFSQGAAAGFCHEDIGALEPGALRGGR